MLTADELIAFEDGIAADFNAGGIAAPCHLAGGNELALIEIFKRIAPTDWVLCQWRSHYHALLHGVPPSLLRARIMEGRSIALCFAAQRFLCSAIVGGIMPIAVGLAWGIKQRGGSEKVHCFVGDMTMRSGIAHESRAYAAGHKLPLVVYEEDNGLSVCTDTQAVWGKESWQGQWTHYRYRYTLNKPHVGTGKFVRF